MNDMFCNFYTKKDNIAVNMLREIACMLQAFKKSDNMFFLTI